MNSQEKIAHLAPLALAWSKAQEALILRYGFPLGATQVDDARRAGVQDPERVRLLVVDRIPLPDDPDLAEAAGRAQIITTASRAVTVGHGIILRADSWKDRELLIHSLVHVAQCERSGGLETFVEEYISNRATSAEFSVGSLEDEARQLARQICDEDKATLSSARRAD